ncbi:MAG TPA: 3-hydroxybutyrate dehydrogenase [Arenicellales bacterium]|nr:3-hydroxybutyrate dehydrogenase [Arenicellales bacterium]
MKGKNAIITGSSSGIGLGIAKRFAAEGMNVLMNGIEPADQVEGERAGIESEHGVQALYSQADMTKPAEIRQLVELGESSLGQIDVLVNNAGIQFVSPIEEFPDDKWDAIIAVNLSSSFHAIKAALPGMKQRGWGRIVNIASAHGLVASPYKVAYVAAKHGVVGLTKTVALEAAEAGVTVNAICPGYVWTPLVAAQVPDTARARGISEQEVIDNVLLRAQPTKKFVTIEEVAELACFLCGDAAGNITGTTHSVDGGWTAQ